VKPANSTRDCLLAARDTIFSLAGCLTCPPFHESAMIASWKRHVLPHITRRCRLIPYLLLSVSFKEAAQVTSVSKTTLRRYAKDGRLRTVRLGRRRVIPYDALKELIRDGSTETPGGV
jgi:excisionase family DNA binding protein